MPSVTEVASGTQTATISSEHTLGSALTTADLFVLDVNRTNMAAGDTLTIRAYKKCISAGTLALWDEWSFTGVAAPGKIESVEMHSLYSAEFRIVQTAGTGRSYEWSIAKAS